MEITKDKYRFLKQVGRRTIIFLPDYECESKWRWFKMPDDVFDHKEYPVCACGFKFVPLKKDDRTCIFCQRKYESLF